MTCALSHQLNHSDGAPQVAPVVNNPPTSAGDARDAGLILGLGRSPWRSKWEPNPVLVPENPMDRGAWQATVCGVAKESDTTEQQVTRGPMDQAPWLEFLFVK